MNELFAFRRVPSPNFDMRPEGCEVELLVIHYISLPPKTYGGAAVEQFFTNQLNPDDHPFFQEIKHLRVSSHYFIRRTGELIEFVAPQFRAWHAGESSFKGRRICNDFSVGIELEGCGEEVFTDEQYQTLSLICCELRRNFPTLHTMTGHEHIAPQRKFDPGPYFDWARAKAACGLEVWLGDASAC